MYVEFINGDDGIWGPASDVAPPPHRNERGERITGDTEGGRLLPKVLTLVETMKNEGVCAFPLVYVD